MKVKGYKIRYPDIGSNEIYVEGELGPDTVKQIYAEHGTFEPCEFEKEDE